MKYQLPHLINIPPFILREKLKNNNNIFKFFLILLQGKLSSLVINYFQGLLFCLLMKMIFPFTEKLGYEDNKYFKIIEGQKIYFPNKRIVRIYLNPIEHLDRLYSSYCLEEINFNKNDTVIDCGANVGELNVALKIKNIDINYYAFEPDYQNFICLMENNLIHADNIFDSGLSNQNQSLKFFLDNEGGNSSFYDFGSEEYIEVNTLKLDDLEISGPIKLIKIEAEGFEPEVLQGCSEKLKITEFVCVDFGSERGVNQENTVVDVNKILIKSGFELIKFSDFRYIGLYKNKNF